MNRGLNRELVRKADINLSQITTNGGLLNPEQENAFFKKMLDAPTILNEARTVFMRSPKREINKIGFGQRILKNALLDVTSAPLSAGSYPQPLTAANRSAPTTEKVVLDTKEVIAQINLPYDVIEDNIEGENFTDSIMTLIAERAALDVEDLIINGDTVAGADNYMKTLDGVLKQSTTNVADAFGNTVSKSIFKTATQTMPSRYLRNRNSLRFYISVNNETEYRDTLADRQTGLGDSTITGLAPVYAFGTPVVPVALMPADKGLFIDPKNIIVGFHRRVQIETDKDIQSRVWIIVLTMRLDVKLEEEPAVVKLTNLG